MSKLIDFVAAVGTLNKNQSDKLFSTLARRQVDFLRYVSQYNSVDNNIKHNSKENKLFKQFESKALQDECMRMALYPELLDFMTKESLAGSRLMSNIGIRDALKYYTSYSNNRDNYLKVMKPFQEKCKMITNSGVMNILKGNYDNIGYEIDSNEIDIDSLDFSDEVDEDDTAYVKGVNINDIDFSDEEEDDAEILAMLESAKSTLNIQDEDGDKDTYVETLNKEDLDKLIEDANKQAKENDNAKEIAGGTSIELADDEEDTEDIPEEFIGEYDDFVAAEIDSTLKIYYSLFNAGLELDPPMGILTSEGYMRYTKNGCRNQRNLALRTFFKALNNILGNQFMQATPNSKPSAENISELGMNYFPEYMVKNAYALRIKNGESTKLNSWKSYMPIAKAKVTNAMNNALAYALKKSEGTDGDKRDAFIKKVLSDTRIALTNCIVLSNFDADASIEIRLYCKGIGITEKQIQSLIDTPTEPLFGGRGKVTLCERDKHTGVMTIIVIFDEVSEGRKPLFAYEAIQCLMDKGEPPSWDRFIVGKNVKTGSIQTINLSDADSYNCTIGAGPRSGKGVTTLNILATAVASRFPIFYLDGKPEMASMMWDMGKKYNVPTFAVDTNVTFNGMKYTNIPKYLHSVRDITGGLLAYCKGIQLGMVLSSIRQQLDVNKPLNFNIGSFELLGSQRMVIVGDEIVKFKEKYDILMMLLPTLIDKAKKEKEAGAEKLAYLENLKDWIVGLDKSMPGCLNSEIPMARQNWFWLTQKLDISTWQEGTNEKVSNIVRRAVRKTKVIRLVGNGMIGGKNELALPQNNTTQAAQYINGNMRCFGLHYQESPTDYSNIEIIKPYLILPTVAPGSEPVRYLLETPEKSLRTALTGAKHPDTGQPIVRKEVSFEGVIEMLMGGNQEDIGDALRMGYDLAHKVLSLAGMLNKYSNEPYEKQVYCYMYDADIDTLVSKEVMVDLIRNGGKPQDLDGDTDLVEGVSNSEFSYDDDDIDIPDMKDEITSSTKEAEEISLEGIGNIEGIGSVEDRQDKRNPYLDRPIPTEEQVRKEAEIKQAKINEEQAKKKVELASARIEENQKLTENMLKAFDLLSMEPNSENAKALKEKFKAQLIDTEAKFKCEDNIVFVESGEELDFGDTNEADDIFDSNKWINCIDDSRVKYLKDQLSGKNKFMENVSYNKLWDVIIESATDNSVPGGVNRNFVTHMLIKENEIRIQGKGLNLNGLLSGNIDIRIQDIVKFSKLSKTLPVLKELYLDDIIYEELCIQTGATAEDAGPIFRMFKALRYVNIVDYNNNVVLKIDQRSLNVEAAKGISSKAALRRATRDYCNEKTFSSEWKKNTAGQKAWGSKQSNKAFSKAKMGLKQKPTLRRYAKVAGYGLGGALIWAGGKVLWTGSKAAQSAFSAFRRF